MTGAGEAAIYSSDSSTMGSATAYVKGMILSVVFQGSDTSSKKDQLIALLKSAASRM